MRYFVLTTRGLEDVVREDLKSTIGEAKIFSQEYRKIVFDYDGDLQKLLDIRSVDDVFLFVKEFDVDHLKRSLGKFRTEMDAVDYNRYLRVVKKLRDTNEKIIFSITVSNIGKKNYSPDDIKGSVSEFLEWRNGWKYEPNGIHDVNIRFYIIHDKVLVGIRLGSVPLHRRVYKTETIEGSLKSSVAYCLLRIAELKEKDTLLDPMCGVGTIAIEAAKSGANVIAGDVSKEAVEKAKQNCKNAGVEIAFYEGDARHLESGDKSIDKIVCNLPFNKQIALDQDAKKFFNDVLGEFSRVLKDDGRIVLLTAHKELIEQIISGIPSLSIAYSQEISLFGLKPEVICINKKN